MSEREVSQDSQGDREGESDGEEVVFREDTPRVEISTPPTHSMVSANDLDVVIEGWESSSTSPNVFGKFNWPPRGPIPI